MSMASVSNLISWLVQAYSAASGPSSGVDTSSILVAKSIELIFSRRTPSIARLRAIRNKNALVDSIGLIAFARKILRNASWTMSRRAQAHHQAGSAR